jgi:hypothetical protein
MKTQELTFALVRESAKSERFGDAFVMKIKELTLRSVKKVGQRVRSALKTEAFCFADDRRLAGENR